MLAGTVYFYKNEILIEEMDIEDYYDLTKDEITEKIENLKADKVILVSFSHNHQWKGAETILYKEEK